MGIMVFSLLWILQDLDHQPYVGGLEATNLRPQVLRHCLLRVSGHA